MKTDVVKILKDYQALHSSNDSWRSYHQELADYCLPRKANVNSIKVKGERINFNFLYDSTAIRGIKTLAAGFHSNLTNPSSKWFELRSREPSLMENFYVQRWFEEVATKMYSVINNSNFDTVMQEFYMDAGCFGTGTLACFEDVKDKVRFQIIPIEQIDFEEDSNGRVIVMYRTFILSAGQAVRLWGKQAGKNVLECYEEKPFKEFKFLHKVGLREYRDLGVDNIDEQEWDSVWINIEEKHLIKESGFHEFPYFVGRFYKDPNQAFGYSPAMDVFADIKLVNAQQRTLLRASMKQADPPMQAPSKGYMLPLNFNPAAMNYRDSSVDPNALQPLPVNTGNLPVTMEVIKMSQEAINEGLFVPVFRSISEITKQMTVPEVQRRIAENLVLLSPVVGRFTQEVLSPMILRVFNILYRAGELPEPPEEIQGADMDIVYQSPLAKAQRESDMTSLESFLGLMGSLAGIKPEILDKINEDQAVDMIADIKGVSTKILREDKDVQAIRQARQQAQAQQQQMAMAGQVAEIAKRGAEADAQMREEKTLTV